MEPTRRAAQRQVEYFDKGRMEIADPTAPRPDKYYVTVGPAGKGNGHRADANRPQHLHQYGARRPSSWPATPPTTRPRPIATFNKLGAGTDAGHATDRPASTRRHAGRDGGGADDAGLGAGVTYAHFVAESGHNIPDAFCLAARARRLGAR